MQPSKPSPPIDSAPSLDETAFVAVGSNQGDSLSTVHRAIEALAHLAKSGIIASPLYRTDPIDCPPGSPTFINAVAAFTPKEAVAEPSMLLEALQDLERQFGRRPKQQLNEPRPLDLDLITYGSRALETPTLRLPHPRAHTRRFVLQPLADIAPDLALPHQTKTVAELLRSLRNQPNVLRVPAHHTANDLPEDKQGVDS